ncbi:MAG: tRNA (adenosine(37)-N6)-threonylcarbamoyltransferase complex dimerization subunit type 1 TsaB [Gemmatimonadota bacterium]|nr:tRNA (adenosine(37)-N6)-threonylcarbamoyltransferase complex dimerization subunit type 1 TsaB [Gemmatimonadota bacterium]
MITLALDASTYVGTVAVLDGRTVVAAREAAMRGREAERLMPALVDALTAAGVEVRDIARVVCGDGPGSFTSLRIAASIAKGIATGVGAELKRVSSLALVAAGGELPAGRYLAALDALRGEAYFQRVRVHPGGEVALESGFYLGPLAAVAAASRESAAGVIAPRETLDLIVAAAGGSLDGAVPMAPHARGVARLEGALEAADLASWEPRYGRLAEAQVKWEAEHGRPLPDA